MIRVFLLSLCAVFAVRAVSARAEPPAAGASLAWRDPLFDTNIARLPLPQADATPQDLPPAEAVGATGLTLSDLEAIALSSNPTLVKATAAFRAAQGEWVQVGLYPNPVAGYSGTEIGNDGRAGQQGGYVEQEIITAGKLRLNRNAAAALIRRRDRELAAQRLRVLNDVRSEYFEALVSQRTVEIAHQLVRIGDEGLQGAEALLAALEVSRVDVLQASIEAEMAGLTLINAQNRYQAAWRRLTAVIGAPDMAPAPLIGEPDDRLPTFVWEQSVAQLLAESPELAAARAQVDRARWTLERQLAEPIPDINLQTMIQHDNATTSDIAGAQITLPIPIFNRNQGGIRAAQADVASAVAEVRRLELELQMRLARAFERYANARAQVERYAKTILPHARTSLELVGEGYRQGEFNYITLLTAQRTYFQTNLAYLASILELRKSSIEIEGLLLSDNLLAAR